MADLSRTNNGHQPVDDDPYLELELYLQKAQEEIGQLLEKKPARMSDDCSSSTSTVNGNWRFARRLSCPSFRSPHPSRPGLMVLDKRLCLSEKPRTYKRLLTADLHTNSNWHLNNVMAEFNSIIEKELEKLHSRPQHNHRLSGNPARGQRSHSFDYSGLSPWAKKQLSIIEDAEADDARLKTKSVGESRPVKERKTVASQLEQLEADVEETKLKILKDLDLLETTCPIDISVSPAKSPTTPVLKPQELRDFLRRVEDGIRTTSVKANGETKALPAYGNVEDDEEEAPRNDTPSFDAATQTTPMSLSRSSSFVWISDCTTGSVDETNAAGRSVTPESLAVSAPLSLSKRSLPASASEGDTTLNTSLSSLLSRSTPEAEDSSLSADELESGIGTCSPPCKARRHKKVKAADVGETSSGSDWETSDQRASIKKRERVRRRETWERLRRRNSCKRTPSARKTKEKDIIWVPREAAVLPLGTGSVDRVVHKPPASSSRTGSLGSRQRPNILPGPPPHPGRCYSTMDTPHLSSAANKAAFAVKRPNHLLSEQLNGKSSSVPFLETRCNEKNARSFQTASAASTPTEAQTSLEASLMAARSQSQSAFAELEAAEACRWLKATGFPQYAQMYEDWQFPVDLDVVKHDHHFLDGDSLNALFRRLASLNRTARLRSDGRPRPQVNESEEDDQECALSNQWTFQRECRRWSRVDDIPHQSVPIPGSSSFESEMIDDEIFVDVDDSAMDSVILESFRRSSSERFRHGAKSLLRRMESLRLRSRRRARNVFQRAGVTIGDPQVVDPLDMEQRVKSLACTQISPAASATSSTTPSPDMNRALTKFVLPETRSLSPTPSPCSSISQRSFSSSSTSKAKSSARRLFQRRKSGGEHFETHSDSEYSPSPSVHNESVFWAFPELDSPRISRTQFEEQKRDSRSLRERLSFRQSFGWKTPSLSTPEDEKTTVANSLIIGNASCTDPLPSGSPVSARTQIPALPGAEFESFAGLLAQNAKVVNRWHSFRHSVKSPGLNLAGSVGLSALSVGQVALLRRIALLRLTALLERYSTNSKPVWGWDFSKFLKKAKTPDYRGKYIFGVPLSVVTQRTGESLPKCIVAALGYLGKTSLDQVGLFRKSGVKSRISKLKESCESCAYNETPDLSEHQPFDIADMIKQYFRELPEALLTTKLSETFIAIYQVVPLSLRLEALRCAILLLPDEHREALQTLICFLAEVAALSSVNQMNASNLAVCLSPSLFYMPATSSHGGQRRRKNLGSPDPRELSENKAALECLTQMIRDSSKLFVVPKEMVNQCRFTYLEQSVPVTLEDLNTVEFGDWQSYMNGLITSVTKEWKEKSRGWTTLSNHELDVEIAWKKIGDGHPLRLWRVSAEVEAPPTELLNRILRERHLWDNSLTMWRVLRRFDKQSEIVHYSCATQGPPFMTDYCVLRMWKSDLPRGTCLLAETSINFSEAPEAPGVARGVVLASRYLVEPCGAGKSRLIHYCRVDMRGRSPEWYNKNHGHLLGQYINRVRNSFSHITAGPESKV